MISKRLPWGAAPLTLVVLAALALGCGTTEVCVPCAGTDDPATPNTVEGTGCPDFGGSYLGEFSGSASTCTDEPVLQGAVMIEVTTQGENGKLTGEALTFRLTDQDGNWTEYTGSAEVCAENKILAENGNLAAGERTFRFSVDNNTVDGTLRVHGRLGGSPVLGEEAAVTGLTASYLATKSDTEDPGALCQLRATLNASLEPP